eukprot:TRINITY_DN4564_c0_g1_i1.p1 TRINITY_DN4564_c0_g1~~TRINITY_DN4564_c0_g1_i1.p1  ORF type:complete len:145 (+),score=35.51 TRINITY_DN4564_c0_g1_i1:27-461(+)
METHPLNGTWELDLKASEPIDEILEAQGVGWAKRKVISGLAITETITITPNNVTINKQTSVKNVRDELPLNTEQEVDDDVAGKVKQIVTADGGKLKIHLKSIKGSTEVVNTRSLLDDGRVLLEIHFTDKDKGKELIRKRYYNRK